MRVTDVKRYYVQNTNTDKEMVCYSLTQACEYAMQERNTDNLIHIGGYNLAYYQESDTVHSLFMRCANILATLK